MIEIVPSALAPKALSGLMSSLVIPRPIAWVSTLDARGRANLAPHSFFNVVSGSPPAVMFSSGHTSRHNADGKKDTVRNIEATHEFVVNLVSQDLVDAMNATSAEVPAEVDEFELAGLAKADSIFVKPPRVQAAKAALECRLITAIDVVGHTVVFGEVVGITVHEDVYVDQRIDPRKLAPAARLGGSLYTALGEIRNVPRPNPYP